MTDSEWVPGKQYVIQSGPNAGKKLEQILKNDPVKFSQMEYNLKKYSTPTSRPNDYQKYFEWLERQLEKLSHSLICDCCGQPAEVILVLGDSHQGYTPLPHPYCKKCAQITNDTKYGQKGTTVSLSPWGLRCFSCKKDAKRIWQVICDLLNIRKIKDQALFERLKTVN
ncbi:MAG TPA: hypothetical protein PKN62_00695 [bacterium]|nr:hypothetical protein [bacterium]